MNLLVGLGNPGVQYEKTRHNAGWILLDAMFSDQTWKRNDYANALETSVGDWQIIKPETFMNNSGNSVAWYAQKNHYEYIVVMYDELDLPVGDCKMSFNRGSGGHNGIKSIEKLLGTREFFRIRIGIGKELDGLFIKPNVLGKFESDEYEKIQSLAKNISQALRILEKEGKDKSMTFLNTLGHNKKPQN